jgi:hypothetical protein
MKLPVPVPLLLATVLLPLVPIGGGPDQFLHNLIIIPVLTVLILFFLILFLIALKEPQPNIEGVDFAGSGVEDGVAVLFGPSVEDAGEEGREDRFYVLLVGFYLGLLVQVVFYGVPDY